jgi:hypothetical protein
MTAKCALVKAFLDGRTINIKNCFETIGLTNAPREVSRMVEQPFGVTITRIPREGLSRYKQAVTWYDYKLQRTEENRIGIDKMILYVQSQMKTINLKTDNEKRSLKQGLLIP